MKKCGFCGAELPDEAHFCPCCTGSLVRKRRVRGPVRWRRAMLLLIPGVILAALLWLRLPGPEALPAPISQAQQTEALPEETTLPKACTGPDTPPTDFRMSARTRKFHTSVHVLHNSGSGYENLTYNVGAATVAEKFIAQDGSELEEIYYPVSGIVYGGDRRTRAAYRRNADGSSSYTELDTDRNCRLLLKLAADGTGELNTYNAYGDRTSFAQVTDGAACLEEIRLTIDEAVEEYRQQVLSEQVP